MRPRFIWAFAKFDGLSWILKSSPNIIVNIVTPLCLLFIIYALSAGRLLPFAVVGGILAALSSNTLASTGQSAMYRLEFRLEELLVATKVSKVEYALGFAISSLVFCIPATAIFTLISIALGMLTPTRFVIMLTVVVLLALANTAIALFVGGMIRRTVGMWSVSGILSALLSLIPPTFYPYTALPKPIFYLLLISPVTPAAVTLQGAYGIAPVNNLMLPLLLGEVIFYMAVYKYLGRWRER